MNRFPTLLLIVAIMSAPRLVVLAQYDDPQFGAPPRLATTRPELQKIRESTSFAERKEHAVRRAEKYVEDPPPIPEGFGSWIFYYACKDDGKRLKPLSRARHKCPKCGRVYTDERTIAAYRCVMHNRLERSALSLGWAYALAEEDRFAAGVQRILLALASDYDTYPGRIDRWGNRGMLAPWGGRRYVQSLDEATGVIKLAKAYDLTRTADIWSDRDHRHVQKNFFRATARTLLRFNHGRSNHQTWFNAGLMCIGSTLADAELVNKVIHMDGGYLDQLQKSVGRDGLWFEGTMAYHRYALMAMIEIVEAGRRMQLDLHEEPRFRSMFTGPLKAAYPDGSIPAINDSDPMNLGGFARLFEWAWETWRDPVFARACARGNAKKLRELLGPDAITEWPLATGSAVLEDAGLVRLEAGRGKETACLFFDYGPHGGGHGHFDKLNITLFANGREWLLDPGRLNYRHKEYKTWVKHTVAHNTVVLDGRTQAPTTGRLLWFETHDEFAACAAETADAYTATRLRRHLLLTPDLLLDVYDVSCDSGHQIDWLVHARANEVKPAERLGDAVERSPGPGQGYQHLKEPRAWTAIGPSAWDFMTEDKKLRIHFADPTQETIFAAAGIGYRIGQHEPCLIRRRSGREARFVSVYDLTGAARHVREVTVVKEKTPTVEVLTPRGRLHIRFDENGAHYKLTGQPGQ
jgi:hypothetical protein